jgi:DNA-binding NtrC family response regulator
MAAETPPGMLNTVDEDVAAGSAATVLITASTQSAIEVIARRIHAASARAAFPFVQGWAADLPIESKMLRELCSNLLDAGAGGSMLINDVEQLPPVVQERFVELLRELECARAPAAAVRVIAGTTVSLLDHVAAGAFSERLFYRLNVIHLGAVGATSHVDPA